MENAPVPGVHASQTANAAPLPQRASRWRRRAKLAVFTIAPCAVLLIAAELILRAFVPAPSIVPFTPEVYEDPDLFWRVRPNLNTTCIRGGKALRTNRWGFRDGPIGPKAGNEFRVLCLGESTTYGDHVEFSETYAQVAQSLLNERKTTVRYRVINAGAPSYSSFQSLVLLRKLGAQLQPDAVVLYHEGNDYLPVGWDSTDLTSLTDPQRYERMQSYRWLWPLTRLRIYRDAASLCIRKDPDPAVSNAVYSYFGNRLPQVKTRLTSQEQREVVEQFRQYCTKSGILLVLIHPTYSQSITHACPLTDFSQQYKVPLLETQDLFAATGPQWRRRLFADPAHPTAEGHRLIGNALADFLLSQRKSQPVF